MLHDIPPKLLTCPESGHVDTKKLTFQVRKQPHSHYMLCCSCRALETVEHVMPPQRAGHAMNLQKRRMPNYYHSRGIHTFIARPHGGTTAFSNEWDTGYGNRVQTQVHERSTHEHMIILLLLCDCATHLYPTFLPRMIRRTLDFRLQNQDFMGRHLRQCLMPQLVCWAPLYELEL